MEQKVEVFNPANKTMHYNSNADVGIINPPDYIPKTVLYSYYEKEKRREELQQDVYDSQKKIKPDSKNKFPTVLKYLLGVLLAFLGYKLISSNISKF